MTQGTDTGREERVDRGDGDLVDRLGRQLSAVARAPLASYQVVLVVTALLTVIGLGMVLSSSNVLAFSQENGSPFDIFARQALFVALGWLAFYVALRLRFSLLRRVAAPALLVALALNVLVLVPGIGTEVNGSRGWIGLGMFSIQPAEIGKLAVLIWACHIVAKKMRSGYWLEMLWPAALGVVTLAGLVMLQPDLGMATIILLVFLCVLWFAGYPARHFGWVLGIGLAAFVVLATTMAYRFERVQTFLQTFRGDFSNQQGTGYQSYQGMLSLADGGLFGVGLGQSSAKWFYLPEATNDFIFAIIGEELGWFGAAVVVGLYGVLGWVGIRIARRSVDPFRRLIAGTVTASIVLQAAINIGYVVGLLPVTGIQLPLISNGGTSAVMFLFALGLLANCARHEPEAISALVSSDHRRRWFSLPTPEPYAGEQVVQPSGIPGRSTSGATRYGGPVTRSGRPAGARSAPAAGRRRGPGAPQDASDDAASGTGGRVPRRGAAPMTGRDAPAVRERERARARAAEPRPQRGNRPTPIARGRKR